ncbi:MAG: sulfide/dihydroorotate dehydrogenase-like FAD/NAD-binding protein, partial [Bacteroidales bacterium]|nr:sulfide/dihydroorotate dehydrogenase-like FAD/NAD-binding protein [Bacteroidales bacterium]
MYKIIQSYQLTEVVHLMEVEAPWVVKHGLPGQFVIVIADAKGERVPLTIVEKNEERQSITIIIQAVGQSSHKLCSMKAGESLYTVVGPLGHPIEILNNGYRGRTLLVAGGVGTAPIYPIAKWLHEQGLPCDAVIGARKESLLFYTEEMRAVCDNLYQVTDDGSNGHKGIVTDMIKKLVEQQGEKYDLCVAIGPMVMMKFTAMLTKQLNIPTLVSLDCLMVDGTGMCGACRVQVNGETKFTCVDGPIFNGHQVDYDEAKRHLTINNDERKTVVSRPCVLPKAECGNEQAGDVPKQRQRPMEQAPEQRAKNFEEVSFGFNCKQAMLEA